MTTRGRLGGLSLWGAIRYVSGEMELLPLVSLPHLPR